MIEDDVLEAPVEAILRTVKRRRMSLGADRAARHQPAAFDAADPCILDAIALEGGVRRHRPVVMRRDHVQPRSEEHTSELQSLMRISYAVFCLKKKKNKNSKHIEKNTTCINKKQITITTN